MTHELEQIAVLFRQLTRSPLKTFPALRQKLDAPDRQGVFVIFDPKGATVLHVGRTPKGQRGLFQRLRDHMSGSSSFTRKYLNGDGAELRGKYKFRHLAVSNPRRRALLEAYAIGHLCPAHIGLGQLAP
jgi:hypothetical protein